MANPPLAANATDNQAKSYLTSVFGTFKYQNKTSTPYNGMTATQVYGYIRKRNPRATPYNTAVAAYDIMLSAAIAKGIGTGVSETGQITAATGKGISKTNYNVVPGLSGIAEVGAVIDAAYRQLTKASMWRSLGWILLGGTALGLGVWWYAKTEGEQGVKSVASGKLPHLTAPVLPLTVMGAGVYLLWFGVSYWEDTSVIWPSDPLKSVLQGKGLPPRTTDASAANLLTSGESSQVQAASVPSDGGGTAAPSGAPQTQAHGLLGKFGWSGDQFLPLVSLWNKESSWKPRARNPTSGAFGIAQALGHGVPGGAAPDGTNEYGGFGLSTAQAKAANSGSSYWQIMWGLHYIAATYGSPSAAWSHEQSHDWY